MSKREFRPCIGCGACCGHYLPMTKEDIERVREYAEANGIKPRRTDIDCPWLAANRTCAVYEARPEICRAYHCDASKAKPMPGMPEDYHVYNAERVFIDGDMTTYDGLTGFAAAIGSGSYLNLFGEVKQ